MFHSLYTMCVMINMLLCLAKNHMLGQEDNFCNIKAYLIKTPLKKFATVWSQNILTGEISIVQNFVLHSNREIFDNNGSPLSSFQHSVAVRPSVLDTVKQNNNNNKISITVWCHTDSYYIHVQLEHTVCIRYVCICYGVCCIVGELVM